MARSIKQYIRKRIDLAIQWRVRDAVVLSNDALSGLGKSVTDISVDLTDQYRGMSEIIEQLDRRVKALEQERLTNEN